VRWNTLLLASIRRATSCRPRNELT
jgi:hypothetical protein